MTDWIKIHLGKTSVNARVEKYLTKLGEDQFSITEKDGHTQLLLTRTLAKKLNLTAIRQLFTEEDGHIPTYRGLIHRGEIHLEEKRGLPWQAN